MRPPAPLGWPNGQFRCPSALEGTVCAQASSVIAFERSAARGGSPPGGPMRLQPPCLATESVRCDSNGPSDRDGIDCPSIQAAEARLRSLCSRAEMLGSASRRAEDARKCSDRASSPEIALTSSDATTKCLDQRITSKRLLKHRRWPGTADMATNRGLIGRLSGARFSG